MSHGEAPVNESEKTLMDLHSQLSKIEELRQKLSQLQPLNYGEEKRLLEEFAIRNTYNSNALEGPQPGSIKKVTNWDVIFSDFCVSTTKFGKKASLKYIKICQKARSCLTGEYKRDNIKR